MTDVVIEEVKFSEELYQKNIEENTFEIEYEEGEENADNESDLSSKQV